MSDRPCYVYLIAHQGEGSLHRPIKVGITKDPNKRLQMLQTANHARLAIVAVILLPSRALAQCLEAVMHASLDSSRLSGEWFDVTPFQAAGILCCSTREMFERLGGEGEDLDWLLEQTGASALAARWSEEAERRHH